MLGGGMSCSTGKAVVPLYFNVINIPAVFKIVIAAVVKSETEMDGGLTVISGQINGYLGPIVEVVGVRSQGCPGGSVVC